MREFKFRIWDKSVGRWLCEDAQYLVMDGSEVLAAPFSTINFKTNDKNYIIQQFTGIKDSQGKEIYDGDILKTIRENESFVIGVVRWYNYIGHASDNICGFSCSPAEFPAEGCRINTVIIGNQLENPELLNPCKK